jgi:Zn-dependent peptidase ImmA (M78 family)
LTNEQVKEIQRQGKEGIHPLTVEFGVPIQAIRYQLKKAGVLSNHG